VFNEVEEILPDDASDVAVIIPAAKPPLPSRLTSVFAVLDDVAELIGVAIVLYSELLINPAIVPDTDAIGIFNV
jgi:hypothetical protein